MIVIVDYGLGNLRSIRSKLAILKHDAIVSADPSVIARASRLILPGVGNFAKGMENLSASGVIPALEQAVLHTRIPILGICLGMQLFMERSEEGDVSGLGWLKGSCRRFQLADKKLRVPHVGWNTLDRTMASLLFEGIAADARFYFTHSYFVTCDDANDVAAMTSHGIDFVSVVQRENIFGTQFHPEKSHRHGLLLMQRFIGEGH